MNSRRRAASRRIRSLLAVLAWASNAQGAAPPPPVVIENELARIEIGPRANTVALIDRCTGLNHARPAAFASVRVGQRSFPSTAVSPEGDILRFTFANEARATLRVRAEKRSFRLDLLSVEGAADEIAFLNLPLDLRGTDEEPFAACALALDVQTNVPGIPGPSALLRASAYRRFGFQGHAAVIACRRGDLRQILKETVASAPGLPHSMIGGPWALDGPDNRGSYLFNMGDLTEQTADEWIALCRRLGVGQIDFHGGQSFRFGDLEPNPKFYPEGLKSLRATIDRLHAAGILAGLHTYAQFLARNSRYVSPVPHPDLGKESTFTLAEDLDPRNATVRVCESTVSQGTIAGFSVRGSLTLQIDQELIAFRSIDRDGAFAGCTRGAHGTKAAPHARGTPVHRLRGCFGLFVPDGDSPLYTEVAARTAEVFNECGFDMIYLDALDGSDAVAGPQWAWHYGARFAFEICKRLKRPALMEMSTFHHHLWCIRSRMGAWDHPNRGHRQFIDLHMRSNDRWTRSFLPTHLGWWSFKTWKDAQSEPTYPEDIEMLGARCIGTDSGLSIMGITPKTIDSTPALARLAGIMQTCENLRRVGRFTPAEKRALRSPDREFTLAPDAKGQPHFRDAQIARHKIDCADERGDRWRVDNRFDRQPPRIRIQALQGVGPAAPGNKDLLGPPADFAERSAAPGIAATLDPAERAAPGSTRPGIVLRASNADASRTRSWARFGRSFPPLDLSKNPALGVWIHGDGKGEVLSFQMLNAPHISHACGDRYVTVDFTGWRWIELVEIEGERRAELAWPDPGAYAAYRQTLRFDAIERLNILCNNIPERASIECGIGAIQALPIVPGTVRNPAIRVGQRTIRFPAELRPGDYLEFTHPAECTLHDPSGAPARRIQPEGDSPLLEPGPNEVTFLCDRAEGPRPRAYTWIFLQGEGGIAANAQ